MGISSAMNAGVMGLQVQSSKLSTISDNIANSETKGYKRASMEFASLVLSERPTTYDAGGVRAATVREIENQGAVLGTRNVLDIALSGKGFLPVTTVNQVENPDKPFRMVRTGSFRPDAQGYVRTTNGFALMGWKPGEDGDFTDVARESTSSLVPIKLDNVGLAADPSSEIKLSLNLDDRQTGVAPSTVSADPMFSMPVEYFDKLGGSGQLKFKFFQTSAARTWQFSLSQANTPTDTKVASGLIKFKDDGTLPADGIKLYSVAKDPVNNIMKLALNAAQTSAGGTATAKTTSDTDINTAYDTGGGGTINPTVVKAQAEATAAMTSVTDAMTAVTAAEAAAQVESVEVKAAIDAAKVALDAATTAFGDASTAAGAVAAPGAVTQPESDLIAAKLDAATTKLNEALTQLNTATTLLQTPVFVTSTGAGTEAAYDPVTGNLNLELKGGQKLEVYVGKPNTSDGLQGLKSNFEPYITKNGSPASPMRGLEIDEKGNLNALFESGFRRTLYRIPVGQVVNPNGLTPLDGPAYAISSKSGGVYFYDAGTGPVGRMVSSALEESTTDVAEELTQLIKTQRAYSSNAKIIQTVDEMLQETTNLKR